MIVQRTIRVVVATTAAAIAAMVIAVPQASATTQQGGVIGATGTTVPAAVDGIAPDTVGPVLTSG